MPRVVVTDHTFGPLDIEERVLEPVGGFVQGHRCKTVADLLPKEAWPPKVSGAFKQAVDLFAWQY